VPHEVQLSWVTMRGDEQLGQDWGMRGIWGTPMSDILANILYFVNTFGFFSKLLVYNKLI